MKKDGKRVTVTATGNGQGNVKIAAVLNGRKYSASVKVK